MVRFWILSSYCNEMIFQGSLGESDSILQITRTGITGDQRSVCGRQTFKVALHIPTPSCSCLCVILPLNADRNCNLLLTNKIRQMWGMYVTTCARLCDYIIADSSSHLAGASLYLARFVKQTVMLENLTRMEQQVTMNSWVWTPAKRQQEAEPSFLQPQGTESCQQHGWA